MRSDGRDTEVRGNISQPVRVALWAKAAGRCHMCNVRCLVENYVHSVPTGELAHNIGAKAAVGSPRGLSADIDDREAEGNLLLLCHACHKQIDHKDFIETYTVERLRAIKEAHESRIERQTRTGGMKRTAVLRVGGQVKGNRLLANRRQVNDALVAAHLLPVAEAGLLGDHVCEFDGEPEPEDDVYWRAACKKADKVIAKIRETVNEHGVEHLSLFATASIPLLVHVGFGLDDKTETRVFQGRPDTGWEPAVHEQPASFTHTRTAEGTGAVVLMVGITGPPPIDALPPDLAGSTVLTLTTTDGNHGRHLLDDPRALETFTESFAAMLAEAESFHATRWHLVAAVPASGAVAMGRTLMRHAHPPTTVYERIDNQTNIPVLEVNK